MNREYIKYILSIALLIIIGTAAYSNTFLSPFQFDDGFNIADNPDIRHILDLPSIFKFMPTRFITNLSLAINYHFGGTGVPGYHLVNLCIHLCAAIMLWWLVILTLHAPALKDTRISAHSGVIAFFSALIFVSHPVQTQAVTYIIQRAASLAALFYISSLAFYARSRLAQQETAASRTCYTISFIALILAMFSKEMAITLPFMIVLYEISFFKEKDTRWKHIMPFLTTLFIIPATMLLAESVNFKEMRLMRETAPGILPSEYLLTQFRVIVTYIRLLFIPVNQNLDYDYAVSKTLFDIPTLASLIFLALIIAVAVKIFRKYRLVSFGIFWFFLTLLPESSVIPIKDVIFEHRLYLPMAGYAIFLVSALYYLFENKGTKPVIVILSVAGIACSLLTYNRNLVWKDELTLWNDVIHKSPLKARAYTNRGNAYLGKGDPERALFDANKAIQLDPKQSVAYNNRAAIYLRKDDIDRALSDYDKAVQINPEDFQAYNNRGRAYMKKGDTDRALSDCNKAIAIYPKYAVAFVDRGNVYLKKGDLDRALSDYNKAIELDPGFTEAYINRGAVYQKKGNFDQIISDYNKAIALHPENATNYMNRGNAYLVKGDLERALPDLNKTIELDPKHFVAYNNRGTVYLKKGDLDRAIADFTRTIKLKPEYANAYSNRGSAYLGKGDIDKAIPDLDKAIALDPGHADAYNNRATAYLRKGDLDQGIADCSKAIELNPEFAGAYYNRAIAYFKKNQYDKSWEDLHRAQALGSRANPEFIEALKRASGRAE